MQIAAKIIMIPRMMMIKKKKRTKMMDTIGREERIIEK
jgi:hypothetical protein